MTISGAALKNKNKTHCIRGHEFTEANTAYTFRGDGRICRICRTEKNRKEALKKKKTGALNNKLKTHCPSGHEYTPENTAYQKKENGSLGRMCRACRKIHNSKKQAKAKAQNEPKRTS